MEVFGLWVEWRDGTVIVSIPPFESVPSDMEFVSADSVQVSAQTSGSDVWYGSLPEQPAEAVAVPAGVQVPEGAVYLGTFKITHYCSCEKCCGSYGNSTAWAGEIVPGFTIAVDPSVIPKLSSVYIDGYGVRRAEDCGGAIKGNKIDVAVSNHSEALKLGVVYKDVWLMK
ncbi:MAG: 3D domain-containing protein [Clostridia bacterium]|nr:3D domain-containing protein [Clostridia bacterium]